MKKAAIFFCDESNLKKYEQQKHGHSEKKIDNSMA